MNIFVYKNVSVVLHYIHVHTGDQDFPSSVYITK